MNIISVKNFIQATLAIALTFLLALTSSYSQAQTTYIGAGVGPIPDSTSSAAQTPTGQLDISFAVSGKVNPLGVVSVSMSMTHSWAGDLKATLISPGGVRSLVLFQYVGANNATAAGDNSNLSGTYTFNDTATGNFWTAAAAALATTDIVPAGDYNASAPLTGAVVSMNALFGGLSAAQTNGTWILRIQDGLVGDTGSVTAASLTLTSAPPVNNNFASRTAISGAPLTINTTNDGATIEAGEPRSTNLYSIWYAWTAPASATFILDTVGSNFDTTLAAYSGTTLATLIELAYNDDAVGLQSRIQVAAVAGQTYAIRVSSFSGQPPKLIVLNIRTTQPLSVDRFGGAGTGTVASNPSGINCGVTCFASMVDDSSVVLTATPAIGSAFAGWSGGGCSGNARTCTVTMSAPVSVTATFVRSSPTDLSGDSKSDILFRNSATGEVQAKLMNGSAVLSGAALVGAGSWTVIHTADFNGDNKADLIWQHPNGDIILWLMDGGAPTASVALIGPDPSWTVSHVADFNADGKADILWRNTNGAVILWLMDGITPTASAVLLGPDPDWRVSHVADFSGDGRADILWRHTNGAVSQWRMNGVAIVGSTALLGSDPDWRVTHVADFNGNGTADILWRHNTNGAVTQWLMNGGSIVTNTSLLGADPSWRVSHVGDFNGDGSADILWRHTNGAVLQWLMSGATVTTNTLLLGPDPAWRVSHIADYNGDGKSDLLWRNTADGSIIMWLMNGAVRTSAAGILGPSPWVVVP